MHRGIALPIEDIDLPPVLYKFRDYDNEYHKRGVFDSEIYIPSPNEFNDPYDCNLPFRYKKEDLTEENLVLKGMELLKDKSFTTEEKQRFIYERIKAGIFNDPYLHERQDNDYYERINREFGVFCLTPNVDNFLMWSYYSNSHTGFAIGYDVKMLLRDGLFNMAGLIDYTDEFPIFPLLSNEYIPGHYFANVFYKKAKFWQHEEEYRLLHKFGKGKVHTIPKEGIKEIIFGCKFQEQEKAKIVPTLLKKYPNLSISQMHLNTNHFGLIKTIEI